MKKTLCSTLAAAFVVGASATTFAAANPFTDVPADHWAYDAVAQLAADGVVDGYGDGTYRGDREITRYEMAQMVARAMAKNPAGADKALVDKLAAEFADELNSLGVRVSALEKKVDNVKWGGRVRYRYIQRRQDGYLKDAHKNTNQALLRLEPQMKINEHWTGKARIDYGASGNMDSGANDTGVTVDRIYVEGKYSNTVIRLGKWCAFQQSDYGMSFNDRMAGGEVVFGKDVKIGLRVGRYNLENYNAFAGWGDGSKKAFDGTASYQGIEVYNDRAKKFTWGAGYQHVDIGQTTMTADLGLGDGTALKAKGDFGDLDIWNLGLGYKFTKDLNVTGAWAYADMGGVDSDLKNSYAIQVNYKGAKAAAPKSWGAFLAYRQLGQFSTIHSTYRENGAMNGGEKGWEIGASYTFAKNILGKAQYYMGENIITAQDVKGIWTELSFIF